MGVGDALQPTKDMFGGGFANVMSYAWVFFILVPIVVIVGFIIVFKKFKKKKSQWTHRLKVRRVLHGSGVKKILSDPVYMNMRRFPLIKKAEVFELEKPLLGGYLLPELDQYSGENEFSIILDINNRIYTNQGEFFDPDKNCVNVSAKHSEIDIQRSNLKADFQNINKINKRVEWATIAKYAFFVILAIVIMVISIVAISKWGEAQAERAKSDQAFANAMESLSTAATTMQAVANTQKLEILPMWRDIYGTNNIQGVINTPYNATS